MALLKNLYLDLSFLNPFKKKKIEEEIKTNKEDIINEEIIMRSPPPAETLLSNNPSFNRKTKELPPVSRRLLDNAKISHKTENYERQELPKIEKLIMPPPIINNNNPPLANLPKSFSNEKREALIKTHDTIKEKEDFEESNLEEKENTFFNTLYSHLSKEEQYMHKSLSNKVFNKNLLDEMQTFWQLKKDELNKIKFNQNIKADLMKKMNDLQQQEIEWQKLQLQHDRIKDELASKEIIIENNIKQMRRSFKKLHLSSDIRPEHYFVLSNGEKLRNLTELIESLKTMSPEIYFYHVNEQKNDFANWIHDVMGLSDLAQNVKLSKNKEQMSYLIENWCNSVL